MSRRFGRNQKRKLKAELAAAQESANMNKGLAEWHSSRYRNIEEEYRHLVEAIERTNPHSIAIPAKETRTNGSLPPTWDIQRFRHFDISQGVQDVSPMEEVLVDRSRLHCVIASIEETPIFKTACHLRVSNGERLGYYVDEHILESYGLPVQQIAEMFAIEWERHCKSKGRKARIAK